MSLILIGNQQGQVQSPVAQREFDDLPLMMTKYFFLCNANPRATLEFSHFCHVTQFF